MKLHNYLTSTKTKFIPINYDGSIQILSNFNCLTTSSLFLIRNLIFTDTLSRLLHHQHYKVASFLQVNNETRSLLKDSLQYYNIKNLILSETIESDSKFDIAIFDKKNIQQKIEETPYCKYAIAINNTNSDNTNPTLTNLDCTPMSIKYHILKTHYRNTINFEQNHLIETHQELLKLKQIIISNKNIKRELSPSEILDISLYSMQFIDAMNDDLNTPKAIEIMWSMLNSLPKSEDVFDICNEFDSILGLNLTN